MSMTDSAKIAAALRPLGDTLYALPPACTTDDELEILATALEAMVASGL